MTLYESGRIYKDEIEAARVANATFYLKRAFNMMQKKFAHKLDVVALFWRRI